jgi:hypothetical protein
MQSTVGLEGMRTDRTTAGLAMPRAGEPSRAGRAICSQQRTVAARARAMLAALLLLSAAPATTLGADKAGAEALFREGKALLAQGKVDEACAKLEASMQAEPAPGTLINLARCHAQQGKTATAWAEYTEVATLAKRDGDATRASGARALADELAPTLSQLTIRVAQSTPGLLIVRDGEPVASGSLGTPVPVDPGRHTIEAKAPGRLRWSTSIAIGSKRSAQTVLVPMLDMDPTAADTASGPAGGARSAPAPAVAGAILVALGGASLVAGGVLAGLAADSTATAEDDPALCPDKVCSVRGREEVTHAERLANASTGTFVAGGVCVAAGVVVLILAYLPSERPEPVEPAAARSLWMAPWLTQDGAGLAASGHF